MGKEREHFPRGKFPLTNAEGTLRPESHQLPLARVDSSSVQEYNTGVPPPTAPPHQWPGEGKGKKSNVQR